MGGIRVEKGDLIKFQDLLSEEATIHFSTEGEFCSEIPDSKCSWKVIVFTEGRHKILMRSPSRNDISLLLTNLFLCTPQTLPSQMVALLQKLYISCLIGPSVKICSHVSFCTDCAFRISLLLN